MPGTITLYKPVSQKELDLIKKSGWKAFPLELKEQPFFYPLMKDAYSAQISKECTTPAYSIGYITRFEIDVEFVSRYKVRHIGPSRQQELWIPPEELNEFNQHLSGVIEVVGTVTSE
jgi:hypothetical protein